LGIRCHSHSRTSSVSENATPNRFIADFTSTGAYGNPFQNTPGQEVPEESPDQYLLIATQLLILVDREDPFH
jgi:hypothetical protein